MDITIKNIGVIKNSNIKLNGITVITGLNSTGKTTVGKTLFSIVSAFEDLKVNAMIDKINFTKSSIYKIIEDLGIDSLYRNFFNTDNKLELGETIYNVLNMKIKIDTMEELNDLLNKLYQEITNLEYSIGELVKDANDDNLMSQRIVKQITYIKDNIKYALKDIIELKNIILDEDNLIKYANAKLLRTLNIEFNGQIKPVKLLKTLNSKITLKDDDAIYYDISVDDGVDDCECLYLSPFNTCWFIDNIGTIDNLSSYCRIQEMRKDRYVLNFRHLQDFTEAISTVGHEEYLKRGLCKNTSNFESAIYSEGSKAIFKLINDAINSKVDYIDKKFVCNEDKLDIRNLASGSKLFLILKLLLNNGCIDDKSLLIFDEPENHLHPDWINKIAQLLVLINKLIGSTILITTHSPNLLLAMNVYTNEYDLSNKFSVYISEKHRDKYMSDLKDVTNDIDLAYSHLATPYLNMHQKYIKQLEKNIK